MNEITIKEIENNLVDRKKEYAPMIKNISEHLPVIDKSIENFGKTQSQFMDNMLTVSHPTPIRNVRQVLAEINKSLSALKSAEIKNRKKVNEIKRLERDLKEETDDLLKEKIDLEILEIENGLNEGKKYIGGAIRKINNYVNQYKTILASLGVSDFSEIDFEAEEEKYHIMKAFEQALCACRSRQGIVDEGNLIYLCQIGINGTSAQNDILKYFGKEQQDIKNGLEPSKEQELVFLNDMYLKYKGSAKRYSEQKGMLLTDEESLLK